MSVIVRQYPNRIGGNTYMDVAGDITTGNVYWVDSATGSNGNNGSEPGQPFATVDYAIGKCTAGRYDVIRVFPGHTETLTAAASVALDVAGVTIVGIGIGRNRPLFNYTTAAAASLNVTAANCTIKNCRFDCTGVDAVTAGINVSAAGFNFIGNEMELADSTGQATLGILTTSAADFLNIDGNRFFGTVDAGTAAAIRVVSGNNIWITNNYFLGAYTTTLGAVDNTTVSLNINLVGNVINNLTASSAKAAVFAATSTGHIANNRVQVLTGTAPFAGAAMSWSGGNYYAATIATAGTLI